MKTYTITQVRQLLNVDNKTLARWLEKAGITPQAGEHDERVKRITQEQLELLASIHERPIGALPVEKEVHPTVRALERKVSDQGKELAQLNTVFDAFMKSVEAQLHDMRAAQDALTERIEQLTEQLALQRPTTANKPRVVVEHTSDTLPAQNVTTARTGPASPHRIMVESLDVLPPDAVPLSEFAQQHGIENSKAFRERIDKYFAHYAYRNERRPREIQRYVTAEQQNAILK